MGLTDLQYRIVVSAGLLVLALVVVRARFCGSHELPGPPDPPSLNNKEAEEVARKLADTQRVFQQYLLDDSKTYRIVPPATIESMSKPLAYIAVTDPKKLSPGEELSLAGLRIKAKVEDIPGTTRKQLVLEIKNMRPHAVAYRVRTRVLKQRGTCSQKSDLPHNAIAIRAGQRIRRSECLFSRGMTVELSSIETVELSELGYFYLTSIEPARLGLESRTRRGHQLASRRGVCRLIYSAKLEGKIEKGIIKWRDLVDFYARHRCQTYSFYDGYQSLSGRKSDVLPAREGGE